MNGLYLNPYVPIVKKENRYLFGTNGFLSMEDDEFYTLSEKQEETVRMIAQGASKDETELRQIFGEEMFKAFVDKRILIPMTLDTDSIYSRSNAYYYFNKMGNVQDTISKKKVLILGCGGIGSHVAWNLTVLGVGKLTIVDFDDVEESNLNRQLLYDIEDIGYQKVHVLQEKLMKINPQVEVEAVNKKIWSKEELGEIVALDSYDLIIKSVDSPARFPLWLDQICSEKKIPYIAGITVSSSPMIGPTYIPDKSMGYTDFFVEDEDFKRVSGVPLQLGVVLYHISSEVSLEAFKVLSGKGELKYVNNIHAVDVMKNQVIKMIPKKADHIKEDDRPSIHYLSILSIMMMIMLALATGWIWFVAVGFCIALFSPFFIYTSSEKISRCVFVNMLVYLGGNLMIVFGPSSVIDLSGYDIFTVLLSLLVSINFYVLTATALSGFIATVIKKSRFA